MWKLGADRVVQWLLTSRDGLPSFGELLKKPTPSLRSLPDETLTTIKRLYDKYQRQTRPANWVGVGALGASIAILAAYCFIYGSPTVTSRLEARTSFSWLSVIFLGFIVGSVGIIWAEVVDGKAGDRLIVENLVCAIGYIDVHLDEWPDTGHKYRLSQFVDGAAQGFQLYVKQLYPKVTPQVIETASLHANGIASLKDEISVSDRRKILAIQAKLIRQLRLFTSGRWNQMLTAELPPKDKTTAPKRHLALQVIAILALLGCMGAIAWLYFGEWAGGVAAVALVAALVALVFMFVPKFADAFSAATAAFKGVKDVTPTSKDVDGSAEEESSDKA